MMDAFNDPNVETVTIMTSSQVGKTEIVNNIIGYYIEHDPSPMLLIMPTLEMGTAWSKDRFAPMLRDTPSLRGKVSDARAKESGNTILHKTFAGGHISIAGANSPASLASRPVRLVLFDEVDRFPPSAGTEGDPVKLGAKRTQTFWNRKIFHDSSPTVKGVSRIEALWNESDKRRFFVPCPKCNHSQILVWARIKWDKRDGKDDMDSVYYECEECKAHLTEPDKQKMIQAGLWRAERSEIIKHAGFHINELYSPWSTWRSIVENFIEAKKRPETLRVWINTTLGEVWEDEESYSISDETLAARIEDYGETLPQGVIILTAGVDVQDDRLQCLVKGWGKDDESWLVDFGTIFGSPAKGQVWTELDDYLQTEWLHTLGVKLSVVAACIDSGGHFTQNVYEYVKPRQQNRIYAVKGFAGTGRPIVGKPSKGNRFRVSLFPVGVDTAKELVFARLQIDTFGSGYMHFNKKCDEEYFKQLTAEKQVTKFNRGFPTKVWVKIRSRNEALDCEVYSLASYRILNPNMNVLERKLNEKASLLQSGKPREVQDEEAPMTKVEVRRIDRRFRRLGRRDWVNDW
jgi:phage terminase large subunit GpA-like protein